MYCLASICLCFFCFLSLEILSVRCWTFSNDSLSVLFFPSYCPSFYLLILLFIFLTDFYWSIIASQYCVSFCCTTNRISHMHTHVPIPLPLKPPSHSPYPTPPGHRKALRRSPCAMLLLPTSQLFYIQ